MWIEPIPDETCDTEPELRVWFEKVLWETNRHGPTYKIISREMAYFEDDDGPDTISEIRFHWQRPGGSERLLTVFYPPMIGIEAYEQTLVSFFERGNFCYDCLCKLNSGLCSHCLNGLL